MEEDDRKAATLAQAQFSPILGSFYVYWSMAEMITSMGLGVLLKLSDKNTHLLTTRMEFAKKAALIRRLATDKKHPHADKIKGALNKIQNESKRNSFAHSTVFWGGGEIFFVERNWEGEYKAKLHHYTLEGYEKHVRSFMEATDALRLAFGFSQNLIFRFSVAAFKAERKASKSPKPPKRKA